MEHYKKTILDALNKVLTEVVKKERTSLGYSQKRFGKHLVSILDIKRKKPFTAQEVVNFENPDASVSFERRIRIAEALGYKITFNIKKDTK